MTCGWVVFELGLKHDKQFVNFFFGYLFELHKSHFPAENESVRTQDI